MNIPKDQNNTLLLTIANNFRASGLKEEQFLNACKQFIFASRTEDAFNSFSYMEKEQYLLQQHDIIILLVAMASKCFPQCMCIYSSCYPNCPCSLV